MKSLIVILAGALGFCLIQCSSDKAVPTQASQQQYTFDDVVHNRVPGIKAKVVQNIRVSEATQVMRQRGTYSAAWDQYVKTGRFEIPHSLMQDIAEFKYTADLHGNTKASLKDIDQNIGGVQHVSCRGSQSCDLKCSDYNWIRITDIPNDCHCSQSGPTLNINCPDPCRSYDLSCAR